jgi:hypothetical protein
MNFNGQYEVRNMISIAYLLAILRSVQGNKSFRFIYNIGKGLDEKRRGIQ